MRNQITLSRLKEVLHYDPVTGVFTWLKPPSFRVRIGDRAGNLEQGYRVIGVDNVNYRAARLAVFYMTGRWPTHFVDHRNAIKDDDRWVNLREADNGENMRNRGKASSNKTGFKGVSLEAQTGKYRACLTVNYVSYKGQRWDTPEQAHAEYCALAKQHHGQFARTA